ncbi:MAG: 30S ribosomal protein S7 [Phycisphaerales bacterium]|nr:30S ribosomal protein S7 [Phycisphaerales bacterium]
MGYKKWTASESQLRADPKYNSKLAAKFVNCMMWSGKKAVSQRIFYDALDNISKKIKDVPPIEVFEQAVQNVRPSVQIRSRRVGGSNYQVPMTVDSKRSQALAIRWILDAARAKKGRPMRERLSSELLDAYNNQGTAVTTRENVHRMADANKAFAHFAW